MTTVQDDAFLPMSAVSSEEEEDVQEEEIEMDPTFTFEEEEDEDDDEEESGWRFDEKKSSSAKTYSKSLSEIIERRRKERVSEEEHSELATGLSDPEDSEEEIDEANQEEKNQEKTSNGIELTEQEEDETEMSAAQKRFYASVTESTSAASSFMELNLSRPLLRAVTKLQYQRPTPIQAQTIPLALQGRDVCASAQTGSGKTAAFLLPTFERLLYRSNGGVTRVLIVTPTRELAKQIHSMATQLSQFTSMRLALVVGGLSLKKQEVELRTRPDVVICTPGRMIDLLRNSLSIHVDDVEVLILDEADRLLDEGFKDEIHELVKFCPKGRQTLLFSATFSDAVDELVKLSLNRPVRVAVDKVDETTDMLQQEFVRVRNRSEEDREAIVTAILVRAASAGTILFCDTKKEAHRMVIILGMCGLQATELHGNLSQAQRLEALEAFKQGESKILVATDLASRGLDVKGVDTVVNMFMPRRVERYIHRVGRTARAGRSGRSITLVGDRGRAVMKQIVKQEKKKQGNVMRSRNVPAAVVAHWKRRIESIETDIKAILEEEKVERQLRRAEMEVEKKINLIQHHDEIKSRPSRTWFQTETEKREIQKKSVENAKREYAEAKALLRKQKTRERKIRGEKNVGVGSHRMTRKKRRNRMAEREVMKDEQVSRKVGRLDGKIRVAKRKEREEEVALEGKRKRRKKTNKKKKK